MTTVVTGMERLSKTVTEPDSKREKAFKEISHLFEPFA